jgi:O-antigen ligase
MSCVKKMREQDFMLRWGAFAVAALTCLNFLPLFLLTLCGVVILFYAVVRKQFSAVVASLALFGMPFIGASSVFLGPSPTSLVLCLDILLLLNVLIGWRKILSHPSSRGIHIFVVWCICFVFLYGLFVLLGKQTDYAVYALQYILVYGVFYTCAGLMVARDNVRLSSVVVFGVLWFSFYYPMMNASIISLRTIVDPFVGLRTSEIFDPIYGARVAGLLILAGISVFLFDEKRIRVLPHVLGAIIVAAPLVWFSYTRQVYVAIVLVVGVMACYLLLSKNKSGTSKKYILLGVGAAFVYVAYKVITVLLMEESKNSRVMEEGLSLDRLGLWQATWAMIKDNSIVGIGVGGFQATGIGLWPHNWFLEAWLEMGLLGLVMAIIGSFFLITPFIRSGGHWRAIWCFLGLYFFSVIQVSGDISRNSTIFFFMALSSVAISYKRQIKRAN